MTLALHELKKTQKGVEFMCRENGIEFENRDGDKKEKGVLIRGEMNPQIQITVDKYSLDKKEEFHGITVDGKIPHIYRGVKHGYQRSVQ